MSPEGQGGVGKGGSWEMEKGCFLKFPLFSFFKKKIYLVGCFGGSDGKESLQCRSLGQEDPLEKGMATHSSILAWRIRWTE